MRRLLLVAALLLTSCRAEVALDVHVRGDGGGFVTVGVGLDQQALALAGGLEGRLEVLDLTKAGWRVSEPEPEDDGLTWVRASKPFATPAEASRVVAEVGRVDGPFREFRVERRESFARTRWSFTGLVDVTRGVDAFGDEQLTEVLGQPLGPLVEDIEREADAPAEQLVALEVAVRLPGSISSNAPAEGGGRAVWRVGLTEPRPVRLGAASVELDRGAQVWAALALASGAALVLVLVVRLARRLRRSSVTADS